MSVLPSNQVHTRTTVFAADRERRHTRIGAAVCRQACSRESQFQGVRFLVVSWNMERVPFIVCESTHLLANLRLLGSGLNLPRDLSENGTTLQSGMESSSIPELQQHVL
jgi:hypothetical protein